MEDKQLSQDKGAVYARISKEERTEGQDKEYIQAESNKIIDYCKKHNIIISEKKLVDLSLINQIKDCLSEAKRLNIRIYKIYLDPFISGSLWSRPELNDLIEDVYKCTIRTLFIKKLSRLERDPALRKKLFSDFKLNDVKLISLAGDVNDEIITASVGFTNEIQVLEAKRETKKLHLRKIKECVAYIVTPFGYRYNKRKEWIISKNADVVREAWKLTFEKKDYRYITDKLKISASLYYKIIKNPNYLGLICHKHYIKNYTGKLIKVQWKIYKGIHKALITKDMWLRLHPEDKDFLEKAEKLEKGESLVWKEKEIKRKYQPSADVKYLN